MKTEQIWHEITFQLIAFKNETTESMSLIQLWNRKSLHLCDLAAANWFIIQSSFLHLKNSIAEIKCWFWQSLDRCICNYKDFCFEIIYCSIIIISFATLPWSIISDMNIIIKMKILIFQFRCWHFSMELICFAACLLRSTPMYEYVGWGTVSTASTSSVNLFWLQGKVKVKYKV